MRGPRILQVGKFYSPCRGGIETHLQTLSGELRKHVDLRVVVANNDRSTLDELIDGVPVRRVPNWLNVSTAPICPAMVREIRNSKADIVHMHLPNPPAVLAYLASGHKGILVLTYHSDIVRQKSLGKAFEPILKRALLRSSAIISFSENYIESSPLLNSFRDRCHVIPFGIPLDPFDLPRSTESEEIRRQHGSSLIVAVGRFVYYKGFEYLIRAMKRVDGKLLLVGDGPLRMDLEREVRQLHLGDRVFFAGAVEDTVPFYQAADLFVLPSVERSEAFGIVQLEAMACGKPVINTQLNSGVPFVSLNGVTGLTVPPGDSDALALAINSLLQNERLRTQFGTAGRKRVEHQFPLSAMVNKTLDLYRDLHEGRSKSGDSQYRFASDASPARI